jgi:Preprotein translocase subunit SecY
VEIPGNEEGPPRCRHRRALSRWFDAGRAGPLLRLYDKLAGFGLSRGTVAALGFMPYLSARTFIWIARSSSAALDRRWSKEAGSVERRRWTRRLTFGLALVQSYGFARFTQTIPGVVAQPGAQYLAETVLVQTVVAMFLMWVGEQVTELVDKDAHTLEPPLLGQQTSATIFTSGRHRREASLDYVRRSTPTPR